MIIPAIVLCDYSPLFLNPAIFYQEDGDDDSYDDEDEDDDDYDDDYDDDDDYDNGDYDDDD